MRTRGIIVLLALTLPMTAQAQTIRVQSGDHVGFTRLVLPIGPDRDWELEQQSDRQWSVSVSPAIDRFDTSQAFELIQRTRLESLSGTETLSLSLACTCAVSSFRHNNQFLVIDIADSDPDAQLGGIATADPVADPDPAAALPNLTNLLLAPNSLPSVTPLLPARAVDVPRVVPDFADDAPNPRLAEAAEIMAEQLARAAASGLLDAALEQASLLEEPATAPPVPEIEVAEVADTPAPFPDPSPANGRAFPEGPLPIRTATGLDPILDVDLSMGASAEIGACQGTPLDAREWSEGNRVEQGLGTLRLNLYDERDVLMVDAAVDLTLHYLAFGFGAEAVYWLNQTPDPAADLLLIAGLVDGSSSAAFPAVDTPEDCSDGELLWRYIGGAVTAEMTQEDTATVQRAYLDLPSGLRDHMGPDLALRLSSNGHHGTARNIRDALHRGGRVDATTLRLLDLDLRIPLEETPDRIQEILTEALRDDGGDPVSIMAHSLAFDRRAGTPPDPARLVAADALMREIGTGPETDDLWKEVLLGHARLGQIEEALDRLGDPVRSESARAMALTDLIADRVDVNDTAALVILAYTFGRNWHPEGSDAGRVQVRAIAALRDEGLFEAAQILRDVRRPLILPAPPAPESEQEDPAINAWTQADWPRLAQIGSGAHADIASRMARLNDPAAPTQDVGGGPDLNALAESVSDSRALRQSIAELLDRPTPP